MKKSSRMSVADMVNALVTQRSSKALVSTSDMIRVVRGHFPACEHTDGELAELIGTISISQGRNVAFDHDADVDDLLRLPAGIAVG